MTDYLHHVPGNPPPERSETGYFVTPDRLRIRYAVFGASARPLKGTVVVLQGRNEFIEKYLETARDLSARGFATATLDWRGQGASDRMLRDPLRGHVRSFDDYARDLSQFFEEIVLPDCRGPFFLLAHSTGALIALLAAGALANRVRRMVLLAPLFDLTGLPVSTDTVRRAARTLGLAGLGGFQAGRRGRAVPIPFATNKLTSDPVRYARNQSIYATYPQLAIGAPTITWLAAALRAARTVREPEFMERINVPTLFVAAGNDQIVSTRAVEDYARRLRVGSLLTIDGARHELLQEADIYREQLMAAFDAFVPGSDPGA